jgi:hypothetical protein
VRIFKREGSLFVLEYSRRVTAPRSMKQSSPLGEGGTSGGWRSLSPTNLLLAKRQGWSGRFFSHARHDNPLKASRPRS